MTVQVFSSFFLSISLLISASGCLNALFFPQSQRTVIGSLSRIMLNNSLADGAAGRAAYLSQAMSIKTVVGPTPRLSSR